MRSTEKGESSFPDSYKLNENARTDGGTTVSSDCLSHALKLSSKLIVFLISSAEPDGFLLALRDLVDELGSHAQRGLEHHVAIGTLHLA